MATKKRKHKQINIWTEDHHSLLKLSEESNKSMSLITKEMIRLYNTSKQKKKKNKNEWVKKTRI